jgi:hypothetical protein
MIFKSSILILFSDVCIGAPSDLFHLDIRIIFLDNSRFRNLFYVFLFVSDSLMG